jgi:hypothetical protein
VRAPCRLHPMGRDLWWRPPGRREPGRPGALRVGLVVDDEASMVAGLHLAPFSCRNPRKIWIRPPPHHEKDREIEEGLGDDRVSR